MLVNTVRGNFEGYTCKEVERVREARCIQGMIANPTEREFSAMVREKLLTNCPVIVRNVNNAHHIYGHDLANVRGKTTRGKPEHVQIEYVQIPWDFVKMHKYMTLAVDVMFVNGLSFLVTSSRGISLVRIEYLPSRTVKRLVHTLRRVFRKYRTGGYVIQTTLMDMEFEKLKPMLPEIALNTTTARKQKGIVERKIRVLKERAHGTFNTLPYQKLPKIMVIELMHFCMMWMNSFPVRSGISEIWSPRKLVLCTKLNAKLHCRAPFESYCCKVQEDSDITNTLDSRTKWAIYMGPTGNLQGSYKFTLLPTGKKITRRKFTEMPVTNSVIKKVEEMAEKDGAVKGISFKNRKGVEYKFDNEEEYKMLVEPDEPLPYSDIPAEAPGILMALEEEEGVDDVVQDKPELSDKQHAILAAENSGLDFSLIPTKVSGGEVIEIHDDNDEEALDKYIKKRCK
jgi:hypothetical protein